MTGELNEYKLTPEEEDALAEAHGTDISFDVEMALMDVAHLVDPPVAWRFDS